MKMTRIINGKIVTPDGIERKKALLLKQGKILDICSAGKTVGKGYETIDARGGYVIPGLVDIHCDALEFKMSPRPNVTIPRALAFSYYEKELLGCGITTQFHGIYWGDALEKHRSLKLAQEMIKRILDYREVGILNHKIFIRFDIVNCEAKDKLTRLMNKRVVDLLSFQYHLPGHAQFKNLKAFRDYYIKVRGWTEKELNEFIKGPAVLDLKKKDKLAVLTGISQTAEKFQIPLVSHDDDSREKIQLMKKMGAKISEFPISREAALCAKENNMYTVVGAPNIVQGKSSCGNISALTLIKEKAADIICSDYHLPSMLYAAIKLHQEGILSLPEAVNMITLNPAKAAGLKETGAILPGKTADIVIFKLSGKMPGVTRVFIRGRSVCSYAG